MNNTRKMKTRGCAFHLAAAIIFLSGCDRFMTDADTYDYSIEQQMNCFCSQGGQWVRLHVKADTIADATNISNGNHLTSEQWQPYRTIHGLFDEITKWDTSMYHVDVTIDSTFGYPSFLSIYQRTVVHGDTIPFATDGGFNYTTRNYVTFNR